MCGIVGILHLDRQPVDPEVLTRMTRTLAHRGPDGEGVWIDGNIGLGHRRLAIRDLSSLGHQPMHCTTGRITVTFNGEIYNYEELRSELERSHGAVFRSHCDTEIIPAGYLAWGDQVFARLEGIFAIGLWDSQCRRLVLARDSIGVKPVFYSRSGDTFRFASEIKAILADPGQPRRLDPAGLHRLFASGYVGPDATTLEGIHQLEPGSVLSLGPAGETAIKRFWEPSRHATIHRMEEALEIFLPLMTRVVKEQLVSDIDIGILQSGGIDSTILALTAGRVASVPLFTASFANKAHDESELAAQVAACAGLQHHLVDVSSDRDAVQTFKRVVHHYDGQAADEAAGPLLLLTEALGKSTRVALSGDGGDEFFGGYPTYRATRIAAMLDGLLPTHAAETIGRLLYGRGNTATARLPVAAVASRFLQGIAYGGRYAHTEWRRFLPQFLATTLYGTGLREWAAVSPMTQYRHGFDACPGASVTERAMIADQRVHLPGGLMFKTDCMSMANSVEIRVPFLDRRIMEFAASCSETLLLPRTGPTKPLLRNAVRLLGGPTAVSDGKKRGFNNPIAALLRGPLASMADHLIVTNSGLMEPYLRPEQVATLWEDHRSGRRDHAYALWPILHFLQWREANGIR